MGSRSYNQTRRAEATAGTRRAIVAAARELFEFEERFDLGLDEVAARAGCSERTVLRHFGSKEGMLVAAVTAAVDDVAAARSAASGDVAGSIGRLVDHYEEMGDRVVAWLALADRYPLVRRVTEAGIEAHEEWVDTVFGPQLRSLPPARRRQRRAALAALTDVQFWHLLRRRQGLGRAAAEAEILTLARAAIER